MDPLVRSSRFKWGRDGQTGADSSYSGRRAAGSNLLSCCRIMPANVVIIPTLRSVLKWSNKKSGREKKEIIQSTINLQTHRQENGRMPRVCHRSASQTGVSLKFLTTAFFFLKKMALIKILCCRISMHVLNELCLSVRSATVFPVDYVPYKWWGDDILTKTAACPNS